VHHPKAPFGGFFTGGFVACELRATAQPSGRLIASLGQRAPCETFYDIGARGQRTDASLPLRIPDAARLGRAPTRST